MRVDIEAILADPAKRRELVVRAGIAIQAREGIETSRAQMEAAYDRMLAESKKQAPGASTAEEGCEVG